MSSGHTRTRRTSPRGRRTLIIALVIGAFIAVGLYLSARDDPPPEDAHLRITYENIPGEENALTYFNQAAEALDWPEHGDENRRARALLDEDGWDEAFAADLVARNESVFELVERGLGCPRFQVPGIRTYDALLPDLKPWKAIGRLGAIRAELLFSQGQHHEAFEQTIQVVRFGRRIQNGRGSIIHYLVGTTIKRIGLERLRLVLERTTLERDALTPFIDQLGECGSSPRGLADAFRAEYVMADSFIEDFARGEPAGILDELTRAAWRRGFFFKPNRTKRMFAGALEMLIDNTTRTYAESRFPDVTMHGPQWWWTARAIMSGNAVGKIFFHMLMPALHRLQGVKCRDNFTIAATQTLIALKCYKADHGGLPDTLDALVPDYLDAVPLDDFDGRPIRYSKHKGVLYSIGDDLVDAGGADETSRQSDEPTVKIPF